MFQLRLKVTFGNNILILLKCFLNNLKENSSLFIKMFVGKQPVIRGKHVLVTCQISKSVHQKSNFNGVLNTKTEILLWFMFTWNKPFA